MNREDMINALIANLERMNYHRVSSGEVTQESYDKFIESERKRYDRMTDLQLKNIMHMNF